MKEQRNETKTLPEMWIDKNEKNGKRDRIQRYICHECNSSFTNKRYSKEALINNLWVDHVHGNQTLENLSIRYGVSTRTIRRKLDKVCINFPQYKSGKCVIVMDTCYFGRSFGVMVFRDEPLRRNLLWIYVNHETLKAYINGIQWLKERSWNILGIVCDGKRGLFHAFGNVPVQMCQFHQVQIVIRYITRNPKLEAGKELKIIVLQLTHSDRQEFESMLTTWEQKWKSFLQEKTRNQETGKLHYTHARLRSAIRSLKTNLPFLFTYQDYTNRSIPNTTNSLEGTFSMLKRKLRNHPGIKAWRKKKMIDQILSK